VHSTRVFFFDTEPVLLLVEDSRSKMEGTRRTEMIVG